MVVDGDRAERRLERTSPRNVAAGDPAQPALRPSARAAPRSRWRASTRIATPATIRFENSMYEWKPFDGSGSPAGSPASARSRARSRSGGRSRRSRRSRPASPRWRAQAAGTSARRDREPAQARQRRLHRVHCTGAFAARPGLTSPAAQTTSGGPGRAAALERRSSWGSRLLRHDEPASSRRRRCIPRPERPTRGCRRAIRRVAIGRPSPMDWAGCALRAGRHRSTPGYSRSYRSFEGFGWCLARTVRV